MTETINLPFEVSARTARLIGRENIASPKGAIIELVKNAYDADSEICIVYFDIKIPSKKRQFTITEYESLLALGIENETFVEACDYDPKNQYYTIKPNLTDAVRSRFTKEISKYNSIFIIDSGEGMNQDIIRNHWMNIGTDNKLIDQFSKNGRIKSGAKGIGRFALDKLGRICEMTTVFNPKVHRNDTDIHRNKTNFTGYKWRVNWDDFEGDGKKINQVTAELTGIAAVSIRQEVMSVLPEFVLKQFDVTNHFESGTILKISQLREDWVDENIDEVYSDLEVLAPPRESSEFGLFFFYSQKENKYGKVESSICDDYDYRLVAKADKTQRVQIRLYRREFDVELIPPVFFEKQKEKGSPFKKEEFINGYIEKMMDFRQLLPGFEERSEEDSLNLIGEFEFTFYYLKRTFNQRDAKRFFYKSFQPNLRKQWLNKFGGIKLYRDNFRVRPYGESKNSAFDWLNLGNRKAASPSGVAKGDAGYRVEPENIAGSVKISRLGNELFQDKSSREGLQENNVFQIFKNLLIAIINVFENDRSTIAREFELFNDEITPNAKLEKLMSEIQQEFEQYDESYQKLMVPEFAIEDFPELSKFKFLAYGMNQLLKKKDAEIDNLNKDQQILRGLASSGIVLASFSHDLSALSNVLSSRIDKLKELISPKIKEVEYKDVEDRKNPFALIERIKSQDLKLQNWLKFSIGASRKDKRKRKMVKLKNYFSELQNDWSLILRERGIEFIALVDDLTLLMHEIDLDSVFNNLLVNSLDAFFRSTIDRERLIKINIYNSNDRIVIDYFDNATGLSEDIKNPDDIFKPLFTTKRNPHTAEEVGTGLGMWIVKSIVEENTGQVKLLFPKIGFGIRISFPNKTEK